MAVTESLVAVTPGAGKNLHTVSRATTAGTVEDEFVVLGEQSLPTYTVVAESISVATAASHVMQIMAGASLNVRIRRIWIQQVVSATAAAAIRLEVMRLTTAGTGGTAVTPGKLDNGDVAAGATGMTLPTVKGTEGTLLLSKVLLLRQAIGTTGSQSNEPFEWVQLPTSKPIIIPAGAANGLAIKGGGNAAATVDIWVEFTESSFL